VKVTEIFSWKRVSSPLNQTPDCFSMSLAASRREVSLRLTESNPSFTVTASAQKAFGQNKKNIKKQATNLAQEAALCVFLDA
jgi:hypothetical protein